jgi:hypothetical protein
MCKSKQVLETKYVAAGENQDGDESSEELGMYYIEKASTRGNDQRLKPKKEGASPRLA